VADRAPRWETAELVAALDAGIAPRLLASHPAVGRCLSCRRSAPCPARLLAEAVQAAGVRRLPAG